MKIEKQNSTQQNSISKKRGETLEKERKQTKQIKKNTKGKPSKKDFPSPGTSLPSGQSLPPQRAAEPATALPATGAGDSGGQDEGVPIRFYAQTPRFARDPHPSVFWKVF